MRAVALAVLRSVQAIKAPGPNFTSTQIVQVGFESRMEAHVTGPWQRRGQLQYQTAPLPAHELLQLRRMFDFIRAQDSK